MIRFIVVVVITTACLSGSNFGFAQEDDDPAAKTEGAAAASADTKAEEVGQVYPAAIFAFQERGREVQGSGAKIADVLFALLSANPNMYLVDRDEMEKTLNEQELNLSGLVKPDEAVKVGQLTGAKILITGSVVELDRTLYLIAKVIGTETGRTVGATVKGKLTDDISVLTEQLATELERTITERSGTLVAKVPKEEDLIAALKSKLGEAKRPKLWIQVTERHVGQATIDPAAETELTLLAKESGFEVIDPKNGNRKEADVILEGEAFSEFAARRGNLISVKARVEVKATARDSGKLLATDRQTEVVVDLAEQIAGKTALQRAGAAIGMRMLPKVVQP